jgi:hypothetical protein
VRILETAAHFHFYFVHERVGIADILLDLARFAEKRAEFSRPPPDKRGFVFPLEMVPLPARLFQTRLCARALSRRRLAQ